MFHKYLHQFFISVGKRLNSTFAGVKVRSIDFPFSCSSSCHYVLAPISKNAKHLPSFSPPYFPILLYLSAVINSHLSYVFLYIMFPHSLWFPLVDRDTLVGITTGYGLDGPGIESRWGRDFPHLSRPALGPT